MLTTQETTKKYGVPNITGAGYLEPMTLPFPMRLAWDKTKTINKIYCHKDIKAKLYNALSEILHTYGLKKIQELGIDLYGGCFNYRKMRNGNSWSKHSWGLAIDLDPERNQLKTPYLKSNFSKQEYKKLHEIFEKHGFINLGKQKGYDAMHFEKNE